MIPPFDEQGNLPPGMHQATWEEVIERLGWNPQREPLLAGLQKALDDLKAAGCTRAWLNGSFVTDKNYPNDFDLCWDMEGADLERLNPALEDVEPPRRLQKTRYRGDVLPNVIEGNSGQPFLDFFQQDPESGVSRGIIQLNLEDR